MDFSVCFSPLSGLDLCQTVEHGCEHQCVTTTESYLCRCFEGFTLAEDGKSCSSMKLNFLEYTTDPPPQDLSENV